VPLISPRKGGGLQIITRTRRRRGRIRANARRRYSYRFVTFHYTRYKSGGTRPTWDHVECQEIKGRNLSGGVAEHALDRSGTSEERQGSCSGRKNRGEKGGGQQMPCDTSTFVGIQKGKKNLGARVFRSRSKDSSWGKASDPIEGLVRLLTLTFFLP